MSKNKHSRATAFKNMRKNFSPEEIEIANIIMERMGSWDAKRVFANDIKCLYLYAARNVMEYFEKRYFLEARF